MEPVIRIEDFRYDLPEERIASYPLAERDASKLLIYNKGVVREAGFRDLPAELPSDTLMVFNNTKVVPARLLFRKASGALIEVFCLEPVTPAEYNISFAADRSCVWRAVVGNAKRWKSGPIYLYTDGKDPETAALGLEAEMLERESGSFVVRFTWQGGLPFSRVLELAGRVPIPPYLNRETEASDTERYQTLYARYRGSVAAPTAGLHFTDRVLQEIDARGIERAEVCLHVGAGTFLSVKSAYIADHTMHSEPFSVSRGLLEQLRKRLGNGHIAAVGTTSVRTLESLYFLGVHCLEAGPAQWVPDDVAQWEPYRDRPWPAPEQALEALLAYLEFHGTEELRARTRIIIVPGYRFRLVDVLVTNFHQPQSTLLLLISAFTGAGAQWRRIYDYALSHGFRFLSYGDSSLLFREDGTDPYC